MHELGLTRSIIRPDHLLQTPETFVRTAFPGMSKAVAIVHIAPRLGANFTQYTLEFEQGGSVPSSSFERFVYVMEGELDCGSGTPLGSSDFCYIPAGEERVLKALSPAKAAVFEKDYVAVPGINAPAFYSGSEKNIAPVLLGGDPGLEVRCMVPDEPAFDLAVNTMIYQPGATLPGIEIHIMEHGLLMLEGGGIYRLNDSFYPVAAGDFIWMAPYCPQWFGALGKTPSKYLIYKDWNRHPLSKETGR